MGYSRQPMVTAPGEFALRGGILDLYPLHMEDPVRIELFDTEVDSIRTFSAEITFNWKIRSHFNLAASEFVWTEEDILTIAEKLEVELAKV